jgi:hypothetical protein
MRKKVAVESRKRDGEKVHRGAHEGEGSSIADQAAPAARTRASPDDADL